MNYDKLILGSNCSYDMNSKHTQLNNNVIVCGGSGSGKTMSIIEPRLLQANNSNLIVSLSKRRLVTLYAEILKMRGYEVWDLNFACPEESDISYDPLHYLKSFSDITFLAKAIIMANPRKEHAYSDPYWDEGAISLLSAEIAYIIMTKKRAGFLNVLDLHSKLDFKSANGLIETSLDRHFKMIQEKDPDCFAISCWHSFNRLPIKTAACIYSELNTMLDTIFTPEIREMMRKSKKVDFEEFSTKKTVLFITTSAVNPSLHTFVNMFYAQAFKELFEYAESREDGILPIPVQILCDDFAVGSTILNFPDYISIFREKNISVMLLIQSESQLESMYGVNDATTILNNCDTYVYLGGMDLNTSHKISMRLNVPMDEVLYMAIGQEIVFRRGQRPVITERYNILEDEQYKELILGEEKNTDCKNGIGEKIKYKSKTIEEKAS